MNSRVEINQGVVILVLTLGAEFKWVKGEIYFIQMSFTYKPLSLDSSYFFKQASDSAKFDQKSAGY